MGFRYRMMELWGKPEQRESRSGVRGGTGTSCKTEEEGIQNTELRFEGVCHLPRERKGTPQSPTGSEMHSISCSFYLFVLPSISSRALSSLALASYSSSMNSCCRFLPERKNPIVSHLPHRGKDKSDIIFATVKVQRPPCFLSRQHCRLCSWLWCHSAMINQCVFTPETYPKFTCKQLKSCQCLSSVWREGTGQ